MAQKSQACSAKAMQANNIPSRCKPFSERDDLKIVKSLVATKKEISKYHCGETEWIEMNRLCWVHVNLDTGDMDVSTIKQITGGRKFRKSI